MLDNLEHIISKHKSKDRPIVVFTSLWPFLRLSSMDPHKLSLSIIDTFLKFCPNLLMPTFTNGFNSVGRCDLDSEKSKTGMISEIFRTQYATIRTLSAFFSFAAIGKHSDEISNLKPSHAWGDGSLYHWFEESDALFVTLGTHPTHISYLHRFEWLYKNSIPYRMEKIFAGKLIREGKAMPISENLFVRLNDTVLNDFTILLDPLKSEGMKLYNIDGIPVSFTEVSVIKKTCNDVMNKNPLSFLRECKNG